MPRALFSPRAREDLFDIWLYIAAHNTNAADDFIAKILEVADLVTALPYIGRIRNELKGRPRSIAVDSYVLFYQTSATGSRVLRVLHGSRDIPLFLIS